MSQYSIHYFQAECADIMCCIICHNEAVFTDIIYGIICHSEVVYVREYSIL